MYKEKEINKKANAYAKKEALETCGFECVKCGIAYKECAHYDALYSIEFRRLSNSIDVCIIDWLSTVKDSSNIISLDIGNLYFINKIGTCEYKIGITNNVNNRISSIKSSSGNEIKIICTIKNNNISFIENILHSEYAKYNKCGEWFIFTPSQVKEVKKHILSFGSKQVIL